MVPDGPCGPVSPLSPLNAPESAASCNAFMAALAEFLALASEAAALAAESLAYPADSSALFAEAVAYPADSSALFALAFALAVEASALLFDAAAELAESVALAADLSALAFAASRAASACFSSSFIFSSASVMVLFTHSMALAMYSRTSRPYSAFRMPVMILSKSIWFRFTSFWSLHFEVSALVQSQPLVQEADDSVHHALNLFLDCLHLLLFRQLFRDQAKAEHLVVQRIQR